MENFDFILIINCVFKKIIKINKIDFFMSLASLSNLYLIKFRSAKKMARKNLQVVDFE